MTDDDTTQYKIEDETNDTTNYKTEYNGQLSDYFSKIEIKGQPRSHQGNDRHVGEWRQEIQEAINKKIKKLVEKGNFIQPAETDEYNFYIVFRLHDEDKKNPQTQGYKNKGKLSHNPYRDMDIDNLLKISLDSIKETSLLRDDNLIKGIKVFKEPVSNKHAAGLSFQCITTKTFTIESVEQVPGVKLMPDGYWESMMQYITATDLEGNRGTFLDNSWGRIFIAKKNTTKYLDAIPGYNWSTLKKGQQIKGCMVFKRNHLNKEGDASKDFFWLQKWAWW